MQRCRAELLPANGGHPSDCLVSRNGFPVLPEMGRFRLHGGGHVRARHGIPDFAQIITTDIQEIAEDVTWGRTRSRVYNLTRHLDRVEFTPELASEVVDILRDETGLSCQVEWVSIDNWRVAAEEERAESSPAVKQSQSSRTDETAMSDEEVDAILEAAEEKGEVLQRVIVKEAGGLLTAAEAAELSGLSPKTLRARMNVSLLAVPFEGGVGWTKFQFENPEMMAAIGRVMKRMGIQAPWMQLNFFFLRFDELAGRRPIDAIKAGENRAVEIAASHYGVHGGS